MPSRHRGVVEVQLYPFSTLVLEGGRWSVPCPSCFTPRKETRYPLYRGRVGLGAGLDGFGKSCPHRVSNPGLSSLTPGKEIPFTLYRRQCWPQGCSGWVRKIIPHPGFEPWTVQPVVSRYADYTVFAAATLKAVTFILDMVLHVRKQYVPTFVKLCLWFTRTYLLSDTEME
jgi:hypothetical protein